MEFILFNENYELHVTTRNLIKGSIRKHNKGLPRVDRRVCGFFMFMVYPFQQTYRYPRIITRTRDARAAAKCWKTGDEQNEHFYQVQLLIVSNRMPHL